MTNLNRREALVRLGGLFGLGVMAGQAAAADTLLVNGLTVPQVPAGKPFSIAHFTDVHIFGKKGAEKWVSRCLNHLQSQSAKPALILNTGDTIMDSAKTDKAESLNQWKIWNATVKRECSIPIYSALGNHDVWSMKFPEGPDIGDPLYGKKMALDNLGMEKTYYSFDQGGWHFIMLDSIHPTKTDAMWIARLDDEQFEWLKNDLAATPADRPVVVCSHMPIIQVCSMRTMKPNEDNNYEFGPTSMMTDARRIIDLFAKHPNVKLCYSGHVHSLDRIELMGVTYICGGAVCGAKWNELGRYAPQPGYSVATLHPDGKFESNFHSYGWKLDD